MKIKAVEIKLNRAEGMTHETGEKIFVGENIWQRAEWQITEWSRTAPGPKCGYHKTDYEVKFADGFIFGGRIDLTAEDCPSLADTMAREILFYAGEFKPDHMTEKTYTRFLNDCGPDPEANKALYRKAWQTYDIPSGWARGRGK